MPPDGRAISQPHPATDKRADIRDLPRISSVPTQKVLYLRSAQELHGARGPPPWSIFRNRLHQKMPQHVGAIPRCLRAGRLCAFAGEGNPLAVRENRLRDPRLSVVVELFPRRAPLPRRPQSACRRSKKVGRTLHLRARPKQRKNRQFFRSQPGGNGRDRATPFRAKPSRVGDQTQIVRRGAGALVRMVPSRECWSLNRSPHRKLDRNNSQEIGSCLLAGNFGRCSLAGPAIHPRVIRSALEANLGLGHFRQVSVDKQFG